MEENTIDKYPNLKPFPKTRDDFFYNHIKTKVKKPTPRYRSQVKYDFLQYTRIVFKWATLHYELSRGELELLLYLYPKGVFKKTTFFDFQKTVGMYQQTTFTSLNKRGWFHLWRKRKNKGESDLYTLSDKGKRMCAKLHKICIGEEDLPTDKKNKLVKDNTKRVHKYYVDIIKKMNRDKREKV